VGVFERMNRDRYLSTSHSPKGRVEKVAGGETEFVFLSSFEPQRGRFEEAVSESKLVQR
jgi:hypothetical protein